MPGKPADAVANSTPEMLRRTFRPEQNSVLKLRRIAYDLELKPGTLRSSGNPAMSGITLGMVFLSFIIG